MVAPTWCHGPIGGNPVWGDCWQTWLRNWHTLIQEFSSSKGKQSAFFQVSHRRSMCWTTCRCAWLQFLFYFAQLTAVRNLHFPPLLERLTAVTALHEQASGHAFRCGATFFWFSWWGQQVVHLINELVSCLCPIWVDRPRSRNGNKARTFMYRNWIPMFLFLFSIN